MAQFVTCSHCGKDVSIDQAEAFSEVVDSGKPHLLIATGRTIYECQTCDDEFWAKLEAEEKAAGNGNDAA